jgi:hypothetical protein
MTKIFVVLFLTATQLGFGQTAKWKVYVHQTGDDAVGSRLAYAVKEQINRSTRYELTTRENAHVMIQLVSVDDSGAGATALKSAVAVLETVGHGNPRTILQQEVFVVGKDRVDDIASELLADFDQAVTDYFRGAHP